MDFNCCLKSVDAKAPSRPLNKNVRTLYAQHCTYRASVNINFKEDDMGVLVAQHVENRRYSDTWLAPTVQC